MSGRLNMLNYILISDTFFFLHLSVRYVNQLQISLSLIDATISGPLHVSPALDEQEINVRAYAAGIAPNISKNKCAISAKTYHFQY